jgi:hypothetical protein
MGSMSTARRKVFRLILLPVCLLLLAVVLFGVVTRRPEPRFLGKFNARVIGESRLFDYMYRDYEVKGNSEDVLREMRRELIPQGWTVEEGWFVETSQEGRESEGRVWFFEKGKEQYHFQPSQRHPPRDRPKIVFLREMSWIERQWNEALIKMGLRNRYMSVR